MMITGRYYFHEDKPVKDRIVDGAIHYYNTTGVWPNMAHVNPETMGENKIIKVKGHKILIVPDPRISKSIAWIGVGVVE